MKRISFILLCSWWCIALSICAQAASSDKYASISDIPQPLRESMGNALFLEKYIADSAMVVRENSKSHTALTQEDIERVQARKEIQSRHQQVVQVMNYDMNFDGMVTKDEILQTIAESRENSFYYEDESDDSSVSDRSDRMAANIMVADANGDGNLTIQEMATLRPGMAHTRFRGNDLKGFLELDPDKDGKLTIEEIKTLAQKAFKTVDRDDNGIITKKERKQLQEINQRDAQDRVNVDSSCALPAAAADEKIVFIGVYEGDAVSTMSVSGQVAQTDVIPVYIPSGTTPIYFIASSFSPVIWQMKGATERISHVALAGPSIPDGTANNDMGDGKINAGITGVDAKKVVFRHARVCGLGGSYERKNMRAANAVKAMTGRMPDIGLSQYSVMEIHIGADRAEAKRTELEEAQKKAPEGFDEALWQRHIMFMPGGLINVSKEKIVSDAPAVAYQVLPNWAGLAKLKAEGAIIYNPDDSKSANFTITEDGDETVIRSRNGDTIIAGAGNNKIVMKGENIVVQGEKMAGRRLKKLGPSNFKIVKDIPYYPAGLYGAHSAEFVIAKGVKIPKGDPGHSCVRMEETNEPVEGSRTCH